MRKLIIALLLITSLQCVYAQSIGGFVKRAVALNYTNANLIGDGNSYFIYGIPEAVMTLAPFSTNGATMHNFGVSGQTTPQMISDESSQVLSLYNPSVVNVILFQEGGNDIYINGSVSNAINNVKTYCLNARAAGFYVIVSTLIHRDQTTSFGDDVATYNAKLDAFNTAILADHSFYDGIIRPDLEALFATYTSGGYQSDRVHPNPTGVSKYAELYVNAMLSLTAIVRPLKSDWAIVYHLNLKAA